jgi:crotonobetainyl-CoA:carnitine CoA-transferase CaiB-like acyl-CoA transferase
VAIHVVTEQHFRNLAAAMGRPDLADDPRFATNAARVANLAETDAAIASWTRTLAKDAVFAACKQARVPAAPVRDVSEVMADPHMHGRGFLERLPHPEFGEQVFPTTPLRLHGAGLAPATPSPTVGQHNDEVYGGWLGLSAEEIGGLRAEGVI